MKKYDIVLVDGSSYLFRAYHALPPLVNAKGIPTGAIYGVINMIKRLQKDYVDAKIIVVFDPKGGTFRHEMYSEYKSDRGAMPDDLAIQIPILHEIIVGLGLPLLIEPGYEADDVIASLVKIAGERQVLISTLDKDLAQLVTDKVHIINTMHNKLLDPEGVVTKFGVRADQIKDYLSLIGDRSDCIPGIPGVGPKTAAKWLGLYENLDGVREHQQDIGGKVGETLRQEIHQLDLSSQLVALVDSLAIADSIDAIKGGEINTELLQTMYQDLGFKRWYTELSKPKELLYSSIQNNAGAKRLLKFIGAKEVFSVGYVMASDAHGDIAKFAISVGKQTFVLDDHLDLVSLWGEIIQQAKKATLVVYDAKQLLHYFANHQITCDIEIFDIMLGAYVLDSQQTGSLEALASRNLDQGMQAKGEIEYLVETAESSRAIFDKIAPLIEESENAKTLYETIEMPLMRVLFDMERRGAKIDKNRLIEYSESLSNEISQIEQSVWQATDQEFNLASTKQLRKVLFEDLGLPVIEKTPGGEPSTGEATLQALVDQHEIIPKLLKHRSLSKLRSTYCESLIDQADQSDRVHGRFNQAVTITGRLSSTGPNLQNIPIKNEAGRMIRKCFIPEDGYQIVSLDYSQVELRIMAHYSQDKGLIEAFEQGLDIHTATAAKVSGVSLEAVTEEMRRQAKAVNFGLIYGMSAFGLSKQLDIDRKEAQEIIDKYFEQYPGIREYMEKTRQVAQDNGQVTTILGRVIHVQGAKSHQSIEKQAAMRAAINAPMQGSASEIIKLAMLQVVSQCQAFDYHMIIQVHDELVFEVKEDQVADFEKKVGDIMETIYPLAVNLKVNSASGNNWEEAH